MDSLRKKTQPARKILPPKIILPEGPVYQPVISDSERPESDKKRVLPRHEKNLHLLIKMRRIVFFVAIAFFVACIAYMGFFLWKSYSVSKKMNIGPDKNSSLMQDMGTVLSSLSGRQQTELDGQSNSRINILLMGAAGEHNPGKNLTDTIMVMSIDTKHKRMALLSLPRDLYVKIPNDGKMTKINNVYQYGLSNDQGIEPIKKTVSDITGLVMNYYLIVDFDAFTKIINQIGGVNVTVERDILDTRYPGPNYSYQTFELSKGFHTLDGETALKYVRERHNDPEGDFGRAKRQQQVIQTVKNKLFSAQTLLNVAALNGILDTLGENVKTDIGLNEMEGFIALSKTVDTQNIENVVIDAWKKDSMLKVSHVMVGPTRAFILVPRVGNYSEIRDAAENIFDKEKIERRKQQISQESPTITIINRSDDNAIIYKVQDLLFNSLSMKEVRIVHKKDLEKSDETLIQDNTSGKKLFSLDELAKKIPAKVAAAENSEDKSENESDFVIYIGNDLIESYKYEEDSMEDFNKAVDNQNLLDLGNI